MISKALFPAAILSIFISGQLVSQNITFQPRGVGGGGALFAPSINPANDNEYYVGCDMSELFHTGDFGNTYTLKHFQGIQGGHNSKVCFTNNPNVLYCIDYSNDSALPVKSIDGGSTWNTLSGNPDPSEETYSVYADYNNPSHLIISYYNQLYFSADAGSSFNLIHTAVNSGSGILIGGAFFDGSNIYIGTNDGLLVSANGGTSFSVANISGIPSSECIFSFAAAKQGNTTRFFCLTANSNDVYVGIAGSEYWGFVQGVYTLDYGQASWTSVMNGINVNTDFMMFAAMAVNDINTVYLGGSNSNGYPDIMKSTNAGQSWSHVFNTSNNQNIITGWCGYGGDRGWGYAECPFGMAVAPNNSAKIIFSDFGFVHVSSNGGTNWKQAYIAVADQNPANVTTPTFKNYHSNGLENTTCWNMLWKDVTHIFTAFSDINGIRSDDGGSTWKMAGTTSQNSTYYFLKHPTQNIIYASTSTVHDIYQTTRLQDNTLDAGLGTIRFSNDNGNTWQTLHDFNHPVIWLALDPNNSNKMFASVIHYAGGFGQGGIWYSNNIQNGSTSVWTQLPNPPRTEGHPLTVKMLNDGTLICSYSGRRNSSGSFTNSSGVFVMLPNTNTWIDRSDSGMLYYTKDLVIDPYDASQNKWYACVWSGWGGAPNGLGGLYKTTNRGQTWTKIFSGADRVSSITFSTTNSGEVWMTTETQGLWHSTNVNSASPTFSQVNAYPFRQPERVFYNPYNNNELWVTSFGNGLKVANLTSTGMENSNMTSINYSFEVYPNPAKDFCTVVLKDNSRSEPVEVSLFDPRGKIVFNSLSDQKKISISVRDLSNGIYNVCIKKGSEMENRNLIIMH